MIESHIQEPHSQHNMPNCNNDPTALINLYTAMKDVVNNHVDNPQLLLLIGIRLNDLAKVREAVETFGAVPTRVVTERNNAIMQQFVQHNGSE